MPACSPNEGNWEQQHCVLDHFLNKRNQENVFVFFYYYFSRLSEGKGNNMWVQSAIFLWKAIGLYQEFPGGSVVRTRYFHCHWEGFAYTHTDTHTHTHTHTQRLTFLSFSKLCSSATLYRFIYCSPFVLGFPDALWRNYLCSFPLLAHVLFFRSHSWLISGGVSVLKQFWLRPGVAFILLKKAFKILSSVLLILQNC